MRNRLDGRLYAIKKVTLSSTKKWDEKLKKIRKINGYQAQYIKEKKQHVKGMALRKEVRRA